MDYNKIIEIASEIVNNDKLYKKGLTLEYRLTEDEHKKLDEELFYKYNQASTPFTHQEVIEFDTEDVLLRFVYK
jgi:tRNA U34 5-carboxymethylaminomethyl modifying GTPase MnmE/TrmE